MPLDEDRDRMRKIEEALLGYAHTMHEYTLRLWTESRKRADERAARDGVPVMGDGSGSDARRQGRGRGKS